MNGGCRRAQDTLTFSSLVNEIWKCARSSHGRGLGYVKIRLTLLHSLNDRSDARGTIQSKKGTITVFYE